MVGEVYLNVALFCERPHQTGVLLERATTEHSIEALLFKELVGLRAGSDAADATGTGQLCYARETLSGVIDIPGDKQLVANLVLHGLREWSLVAWSRMGMLLWMISTCRYIENIDAEFREDRRETDGVLRGP